MSNFEPQILGITAFMATNRIDFVVDGPDMDSPERCSAFYDGGNKSTLKLDGKKLSVKQVGTDDDGEPTSLTVKWGRETVKLGRRKNASGPVSFYKSLEASNNAGAPKSAEEIIGSLKRLLS